MNKNELLAKLYYELGKQATDFALQHSHKEGEETIWTKRHTFLELCEEPEKYQWFIEHCNHRQILKNEIILDFDRPIIIENVLEDTDIKTIINELNNDGWRFYVYHTGSKGVHIHIYNNWLIPKQATDRELLRTKLILKYQKLIHKCLDFQKASDKTMIALEHTPHWKTGKQKQLLYHNDPEQEVTIWIGQ